jgi:hypothetical protein
MRGPKKLLENENHWETRMGGWFPNERIVYRGLDLHEDLMHMSWMELYLYGVTGRRFDEEQLKVLNALWVCTSYPDPRIWPNRVAALAGAARSTGVLGVSSSVAITEAVIYGRRAGIRSLDFLIKTKKRVESGEDLLKILDEVTLVYGYGRPIIHLDERRPYLMKLLNEVGMDKGSHLSMALEIEKILLKSKHQLHMNYGGLMAAVAADMGFTSREFYLFSMPMLIAGMTPCFIDTAEKHEGTLFPLRCNFIGYEGGMARRYWNG